MLNRCVSSMLGCVIIRSFGRRACRALNVMSRRSHEYDHTFNRCDRSRNYNQSLRRARFRGTGRSGAADEVVGPKARFETTNAESDLRPGGRWLMSGMGIGRPFKVEGVYRIIERPRVLAFTWLPSWDE